MSFKPAFRLHINFEISSYIQYVEHFERDFEGIRAKLQQEWSAHTDNQPDNYGTDWHDHLLDDLIENNMQQREFLQRFRASMLIQLYSFVETELKRLCVHVSGSPEFDVDGIPRTKSDLHKYVKYICKSIHINVSYLPDYKFLDNLRLLRNNFVHHNGSMLTSDTNFKSLQAFAAGNFSVHAPNHHTRAGDESIKREILFTEDRFVATILHKIHSFFGNLISRIP